jgi:hypothetical protein
MVMLIMFKKASPSKLNCYTENIQRHSAFFKEFSLGGGGQNKETKRQNEKYEPSRFGERASLTRDFVKL